MIIGLLIGRFQPFHYGHLYLIKEGLKVVDKLVIGIGSASIFDENNPLSSEQRRIILNKVIKKENLKEKIIKIVELEDFFNDEKWLDNVRKILGKFDLVIGNNEWTNKIMENAGYLVRRFPYYKRYLYEGYCIRRLIKRSLNWQKRVPQYLVKDLEKFFQKKPYVFNNLALGGTFDHFHLGHKKFLKTAFFLGKNVLIGITSNQFVKNKFLSLLIEDYQTRKNQIKRFLIKNNFYQRAKIIKINDFTGGVDKEKKIEAVLVSKNTYENSLRLNELREKNGLKKLRIILFKEVLAEDKNIISSERIRMGEIDRQGRSFCFFLKNQSQQLKLPENLKEELRRSLGRVFKTVHQVIKFIKLNKPIKIIAVGDVIVDSLLKNKVDPDIKIIDFKSRRQPYKTTFPFKDRFKKSLFLKNKAGTINLNTAEKLKELIRHPKGVQARDWLIIDGEEDLLTLPAILFAPLGSLVLYGHWQYGVIGVIIDEKIKRKIKKIVERFEVLPVNLQDK